MSESQTPVTRAEQKARAYAKQLEAAGFEIKITVKVHDPALYSNGEVMFPSLVSVRVFATGPGTFHDSYGFGFLSWLPTPRGRRASTRWGSGNLYPSTRPIQKIRTERELASRIATEVHSAKLRAERAEAAEVSA